MLNRRSLRIKGMQSIFAYQTAREADYQICKTMAQDHFLPDMNTMEDQDKEGLAKDREDTSLVFDAYHEKGLEGIDKEVKSDIIDEVVNNHREYENRVKLNREHFRKKMVAGVSTIYDDYIKFLFLSVEIQGVIELEKRRKKNVHNNFEKNVVINKIKSSEKLETERVRRNLSWDSDLIKAWYKEYIKPTEFFEEYDNLPKANLEEDLLLLQNIFKTVVFKNKNVNDYFEALDLGWEENKPIIKSMVLKSLKSIDSDDSDMLVMELSQNWEEDLQFLKDIYDLAIDGEVEYEAMIKGKSKNWEIDRVALTDRIILEMALAEMTHFTSIPVKVTINEYIELSKLYSTPKSKQFVNGLLDVLSGELKANGRIKKSGRGLLDNK